VTPYYEDDAVTIYHGDCREVVDVWDLAGAVMVTDPPYGIAYRSNMHGKRRERLGTEDRPVSIVGDETPELRDWALSVWGNRPALIFGTWKVPRPPATRHVLTWVKGDHLGMGDLSVPWRPNTEEVYVLGTGFVGHRGTSVLDYQAPVSWASGGRVHPHEKPVELLRALVGKCPPLAEVVDPFMGSGSTLRAAKDLGRKAVGIEVEERYCEIAAKRLGQEVLDLGA
jgi:site-specific DNA-methyltransferase (adenine-specific)